CPATIAPCATARSANACTALPRNPRPPTRSGCVGTRRSSMRDTCQMKRIQMNSRKYQRHRMNWKIGRLREPYHIPAIENVEPWADDVAYHEVVSSTV